MLISTAFPHYGSGQDHPFTFRVAVVAYGKKDDLLVGPRELHDVAVVANQ